MKNTKKSLTILVLAMTVLFVLNGCGTVKKATDDKSNNQASEVKAPQTAIDTTKVRISTMYVSGLDATVSPSTVVEVYSGIPFTAQTLVGQDVATADQFGNGGSFVVDISGAPYQTFYVVATAQGHSASNPVTVIKP
jgi:uncharacterized protein YceK